MKVKTGNLKVYHPQKSYSIHCKKDEVKSLPGHCGHYTDTDRGDIYLFVISTEDKTELFHNYTLC